MTKFIYKNHICDDYKPFSLADTSSEPDFFLSHTPCSQKTLHRIVVLEYDTNNSPKEDYPTETDKNTILLDTNICIELSKASTSEAIIKFLNRYGTLFPCHFIRKFDSVSLSAYSVILCSLHDQLTKTNQHIMDNDFKRLDDRSRYDFMFYKHFRYYQIQMDGLLNLQCNLDYLKKLERGTKEFCDTLYSLLIANHKIFNNPYLDDMLALEYERILDIVPDIFSSYPLCQYRFLHKSRLFSAAIKYDSERNEFINDNLSHINSLYESLLTRVINPNADFASLTREYFINHEKNIINFSTEVLKDFLSFEIRGINIRPASSDTDQSFPTLAAAIFYFFSIYNNQRILYKRCANEYCNKLFPVSISMMDKKKYCSYDCAHRVTNRNYKRRKKEETLNE